MQKMRKQIETTDSTPDRKLVQAVMIVTCVLEVSPVRVLDEILAIMTEIFSTSQFLYKNTRRVPQ
jgi:hypothetical protein